MRQGWSQENHVYFHGTTLSGVRLLNGHDDYWDFYAWHRSADDMRTKGQVEGRFRGSEEDAMEFSEKKLADLQSLVQPKA